MTDNNYITASNPKFNVWVSASAGSGKTKSLTDRYLRFLLNGVTPDKILCLTFTKIAAAEMLTRIKNTLGEWSILSEQELKSELEKLSGEKPTATIYARAKKLFNEFVNCQD
ncbi:MAG: UvrD-helicase domain-containing protein, partial [Alphaproteobacteria bacterium]|nr:UvrD-helicase domain-containing protein [Alphaproteobacteria bacterium]